VAVHLRDAALFKKEEGTGKGEGEKQMPLWGGRHGGSKKIVKKERTKSLILDTLERGPLQVLKQKKKRG